MNNSIISNRHRKQIFITEDLASQGYMSRRFSAIVHDPTLPAPLQVETLVSCLALEDRCGGEAAIALKKLLAAIGYATAKIVSIEEVTPCD